MLLYCFSFGPLCDLLQYIQENAHTHTHTHTHTPTHPLTLYPLGSRLYLTHGEKKSPLEKLNNSILSRNNVQWNSQSFSRNIRSYAICIPICILQEIVEKHVVECILMELSLYSLTLTE